MNIEPSRMEEEIDLLELLAALKKRIVLILAAALIGGAAAGAFSYFALTPQYQSTAMMYTISKETTLTSLVDLQVDSQLTKDYTVIVTSRPVLEDVVKTLDLDMTYKDLRKKITIENPVDTRILSISAKDPDPDMAKLIADAVANKASEYIGNIMEVIPPKLIESGEVPTEKISPNNGKNALMGAAAAALLVCAVIIVGVLLNDTIMTEEDVAKYLGISVLASVPAREGEEEEDEEAMAQGAPSSRKKGVSFPGRRRT